MRLHSQIKYRNNAATIRRQFVMAEHYHDQNDLKLMREMRKLAPEDFNAWLGLNNIIGRENGAIPRKYRELIAIAVSATTQCPYCIEAHAKAAHAAGATREEVVEASLIAAALRAGAAATHGTLALKFFDKQAEPKGE
jgi:AhpD family alkylhydroperoxidase